jgi:hypothetical protein
MNSQICAKITPSGAIFRDEEKVVSRNRKIAGAAAEILGLFPAQCCWTSHFYFIDLQYVSR